MAWVTFWKVPLPRRESVASSKPSMEKAGMKFFTRSISSANLSSTRVPLVNAEKKQSGVVLAEPDEVVLAGHRLTASEEVHIGTHLDPLRDDGVKLLEGEVLVAGARVVGGPAAVAVEVAAGGRVHEDGHGQLQPSASLTRRWMLPPTVTELTKKLLTKVRATSRSMLVTTWSMSSRQLLPGGLEIAHDHVEEAELGVVDLVARAHELVDHGLDLGQVSVEVVVEHVKSLVDGDGDRLCLDVVEHLLP